MSNSSVCPIHHLPLRRLGERAVCARCLGEASRPATRIWDELRERLAAADLQARLDGATIPEVFVGRSFADFDAPTERAAKIAAALQAFCAEFGEHRFSRSGFILIGQPGTGKTHLACSMVQILLASGFTAAYASLPALTRDMRSSQGRSRGSENVLRRLISIDFLVLDEIDLHGSFDSDYNMLYDLINGRHVKPGHPTVAISNRPIDALTKDLDERLISRILAGTKPLVFDWPGRRVVRGASAARTHGAARE